MKNKMKNKTEKKKQIFEGSGAYRTPAEFYNEIDSLKDRHSKIFKIVEIGRSVKNKPILAIKITSSKKKSPKILYTSLFHAMEYIGVETSIGIINKIVNTYSEDDYVNYLLSNRELWFVPVVNPDGYERAIALLEKNEKSYTRRNENNVDLNRNFSVGYWWKLANPFGGLYAGDHPFSEPETNALKLLVEEGNFKGAIAFHSFGNVIYMPFFYTFKKPKDYKAFIKIAKGMRDRQRYKKYLILRGAFGLFHYGDFIDWLYVKHKVFAFLFEIGFPQFSFKRLNRLLTPFAYLNNYNVEETVENNIAASLYLAEVAPQVEVAR